MRKNAQITIEDGIRIETGYCYRYDIYSSNLCYGMEFICSCKTLKAARKTMEYYYRKGKTCLEIHKKRYTYTDYKEVEQ